MSITKAICLFSNYLFFLSWSN